MSTLPLLVVLFALVPLADASPPDPLWIGSIYDAADYDDVVGLLTGTSAAVSRVLIATDLFSSDVRSVPLADSLTYATPTNLAVHLRSPPSL